MSLNKIQIIGIVSIVMVTMAILPKFNMPPFAQMSDARKSNASQMLLGGAVILTGIALTMTGTSQQTSPPTQQQKDTFTRPSPSPQPQPQPQPQPFVKASGNENNESGKTLGERLKEAGWVCVLADWCGFCKKQKEMVADHPEHKLDMIMITEEEARGMPELQIQGFPHFQSGSKISPGYKATIQEFEDLLTIM